MYLTVYAGYRVVEFLLGYLNAATKVVKATCGTLNTTGPGIAFGISPIGRQFDEAKMVQCAYEFEQATRFRYAHLQMAQFMSTT
jgi:amidase